MSVHAVDSVVLFFAGLWARGAAAAMMGAAYPDLYRPSVSIPAWPGEQHTTFLLLLLPCGRAARLLRAHLAAGRGVPCRRSCSMATRTRQ